jgi:transposase
MPKERLSMRKVKELLRLVFDKQLSINKAAKSCNIARSTAQEYIQRYKTSGLSYSQTLEMDQSELDVLFFKTPPSQSHKKRHPDWSLIHKELSRKGVTLKLLWMEYLQNNPEDLSYVQFTRNYRHWAHKMKLSLRLEHKAGEKAYVDFCGQTMELINSWTGEVSPVQVFVASLGLSSYIFAFALPSQDSENWILAHNRMLKCFGGCPEIIVPDNLKSAVNKACRYEPEINPAFQRWAEHNKIAVIPARVRKPKDKSKAENAVLMVERWAMAPLRDRQFFSIREINKALAEKVEEINSRPMSKLNTSRKELFLELEKPVLRPLPPNEYELDTWKTAKVHPDYHVELERHYYSVPYAYAYKRVDVRYTKSIVEIYYQGKRIAAHPRAYKQPFKHSTFREHMPRAHREVTGWTSERIKKTAAKIGPKTRILAEAILNSKMHPEQGFRSCQGLINLEKQYGTMRLEKACERALYFGLLGRRPVLEILKKKQDMLELPQEQTTPLNHSNVRGADFYN